MEFFTLILLGAMLATYGWYWSGVTESRSTAYALGTGTIILATLTGFSGGAHEVALAAAGLGAVWGALATMNAWNEAGMDRTYGLFALFLTVASVLVFMADDNLAGGTNLGQGALVLAGVFALHFISAALVPGVRGFRNFVGWTTLIAGAFVAFIGFADSIDAGNPLF